jgi:acetoin:2,6-dichlorophenolindophenol oxidoreductase subunit beta
MAKQRLTQALNDAFFEEMARDERVILFGEDVEISMFGDTRGLHDRFGSNRIRNTPICEATLTGMAVGAALAGYRVVCHLMFSNFLYTGFDAIANQAAKLRLMTGGQVRLPIVYFAAYGGGSSTAAQHSDTPYPVLMNLGGINVIVPSTPADAKGLLKAAIRSDNPSVFLMHRLRGSTLGEVPEGDHVQPLGVAAVHRQGTDVTIVSIGGVLPHVLKAAETLAQHGISAEILDPRTLVPFDESTLLASVGKTGRVVIVDEARDRCSAASQIAAIVGEHAFHALKAPIRRVVTPNTSLPYAPNLEKSLLPDADKIVAAAKTIMSV